MFTLFPSPTFSQQFFQISVNTQRIVPSAGDCVDAGKKPECCETSTTIVGWDGLSEMIGTRHKVEERNTNLTTVEMLGFETSRAFRSVVKPSARRGWPQSS